MDTLAIVDLLKQGYSDILLANEICKHKTLHIPYSEYNELYNKGWVFHHIEGRVLYMPCQTLGSLRKWVMRNIDDIIQVKIRVKIY